MKVRTPLARCLAFILALLVVALIAAFHAKSSVAQKAPPTTYYVHGRIYTNDPAHPWAQAMAVSDGKISCIGKMDHVLLECGGGQEGAETVQLKGQFVMPGFNDAHVHLGGAAADELAVPLTGVPSAQEMQKRVATAVAQQRKDSPIASSSMLSRPRIPSSSPTFLATWPSRILWRSRSPRSTSTLPIRQVARSNTMDLASQPEC